jgi:hypothetical protein
LRTKSGFGRVLTTSHGSTTSSFFYGPENTIDRQSDCRQKVGSMMLSSFLSWVTSELTWIGGATAFGLGIIFKGLIDSRLSRVSKVRDEQLKFYLSTLTQILELYEIGLLPSGETDLKKVKHIHTDLMLRYSIIGSVQVMQAFGCFSHFVREHVIRNEPANEEILTQLASEVTYAICCDIHGESHQKKNFNLTGTCVKS